MNLPIKNKKHTLSLSPTTKVAERKIIEWTQMGSNSNTNKEKILYTIILKNHQHRLKSLQDLTA